MLRGTFISVAMLMALLLGDILVPQRVAAQGPQGGMGEASRVEMFLNFVLREWQQAWEVSRRVSNPEARLFLTHAKAQLDQAYGELRRGNLLRARGHGEAAAGLVQRANQLLRLSGQQRTPQQAEQALREAEDMLGRMRNDGPLGPRAEQVNRLVEQARQAAADGHPDAALRFALMAREHGRRAWQESVHSRMMAQRSLVLESMVGPLVERATRLAQERNDERMMRVAALSQERLYMARQMDAQTQAGPKARLLESAMREAELVIRTLDEAGYARHRAARAITEAQAALERAGGVAGEQEDAELPELLERGGNLLAQAREKLNSGDADAAEALAEQARRMAQQAIRQSLGPLSEDRVQEALTRTEQMIEMARGVRTEQARELLANAQARQVQARQSLEQGDLRRALAQTRIAARLAQRAYDLDQKE